MEKKTWKKERERERKKKEKVLSESVGRHRVRQTHHNQQSADSDDG